LTLPGPHDIDDIVNVMGSEVKVTDNFSCGGILIDGLTSVTHAAF